MLYEKLITPAMVYAKDLRAGDLIVDADTRVLIHVLTAWTMDGITHLRGSSYPERKQYTYEASSLFLIEKVGEA